jgi:hypothetical protein
MKTWIIAIAASLALISANTAEACLPMPPPPPEQDESGEAYAARVTAWQAERDAEAARWRAEHQTRLWDEADSVIVARIERVRPFETAMFGTSQRVTLRGVRALKGRAYTNRFTLNYTDGTSCGPLPAFDAITGNVGDTFVIFIRGGRPNQTRVQGTAAPGAVTDERIRALLAAG